MKNPAMGSHCILELTGCPYDVLASEELIRSAIQQASDKALSNVVGLQAHRLENDGVVAMGLLAESHISIHTWPELGYAACDIFTSGATAKPTQACDFLAVFLKSRSASLKVVPRGRRVSSRSGQAANGRQEPCLAQ